MFQSKVSVRPVCFRYGNMCSLQALVMVDDIPCWVYIVHSGMVGILYCRKKIEENFWIVSRILFPVEWQSFTLSVTRSSGSLLPSTNYISQLGRGLEFKGRIHFVEFPLSIAGHFLNISGCTTSLLWRSKQKIRRDSPRYREDGEQTYECLEKADMSAAGYLHLREALFDG